MKGKLILVSGVSGAGKTTLIGEILKRLTLTYLQTYTTRPKRQGEEASHEYVFVSKAQYDKRRDTSNAWDHTEYNGFYYGADIEAVKKLLDNGKDVICSVVPDAKMVDEMSRLYDCDVISIWIDTPISVAAMRVKDDAVRANRNEEDSVRKFNYVFSPTGNLDTDQDAFVKLVSKLTK